MTLNSCINDFFELSTYEHQKLFEGCLYPWEALKNLSNYCKQFAKGQIQGEVSEQAYLVNLESIVIGEGSIIEPGAYIAGPCIIGKNCTIRHGAYIRGNLVCGDNCVIGHDTEIKNAIFLNNAHAAHFAYVGDSILGNKVNLGAGFKCANLRLDRSGVKVYYNEVLIDSGLRKLGAIIGDDCQLGCNGVASPGTLIGKKSMSYPCIHLYGTIAPNSMVKPNNDFIIEPI
jgi:NDP-sugar pyrophosphorylase family protein